MGKKQKKVPRDYDHKTLHEERSYGFFWYDWLWAVLRPLVVFTASLAIVCGLLMTGWSFVSDHFVGPVNAEDQTPVTFTVSSGSSLSRVSRELEEAGLIHNRTVFKYVTDFMGKGQRIQSGEYMLAKSMDMMEIMDQLTTGDGKPNTARITIIPGWTVEDIAAQLFKDGIIKTEEEFLTLCKTGENYKDYYYIADVLGSPNVSQRKYVLEGYLSPNTYEVYTSATADDIIKKLLAQTEAVYPATYDERAEELGLTMDQVLTLASMIEKEAKTADFAKVSAVFHNRLKQNMTLGSDVTIKYYLNSRKMALSDEELAVNTGYNTYKNKGLPTGPICNPSTDAIIAALYPDEQYRQQGYLYFCSKDPNSGELHFSKTLEEHEAAVSMYRPLWIEYDKSRGIE
ncbi:endolytic transglycosylase MltG [Beduinella massiliensis]|uniref:endolytic transglycosylase MltG n=1 Tax=Beduinella massiliensis TaxID=1852363 RepID=UPI000C833AC1